VSVESLGSAFDRKLKALVDADARSALMGPGGEVLWSSLRKDEEAFVSRVARSLSKFLGKGDYYVSTRDGERMVILKATDKISLVVVAAAKGGVLLFALKSILSSLSEDLESLSSSLAPREGEKVEMEVSPVEVYDPATGRMVKVLPADAVPYLPMEVGPRPIRLDEKVLAILRAIDGKDISQIAASLGIPVKEACELVADLVGRGLLRAKVVEEDREEYHDVFILELRARPEEIDRLEELEDLEKAILLNLDRGYSVLELSWGLRGLGLEARPDEVLEILEKLEEEGVAKKIT